MVLDIRNEGALRSGWIAPLGDLLQLAANLLEQADEVAGILEFVDVGPDLGLPTFVVGSRFAAGGAACVQFDWQTLLGNWLL